MKEPRSFGQRANGCISSAVLCGLLLVACLLIGVPTFAAGTGPEVARLKGIPLGQAIRIGSGRQVVIEISDPDCRFSRRMVRYWDMRRDVTRYIFLIALKNHPEAAGKVRYILCAANRAAAYREVYGGGLDFGEKAIDLRCDDHGLTAKHREIAARLGVIGTPTYIINGAKIDGAKVGELEQALGGKRIPFDAGDPE